LPLRLGAALALVGSLSAGASAGARHLEMVAIARDALLDTPGAVRGVRAGGAELVAGESVPAVIERRARALEGTRVRLVPSGSAASVDTTFGELGVRVDVGALVRRVGSFGHGGSLATRVTERLAAARGEIDVPIDVAIDAARASAPILRLKEDTDERGAPARYDFSVGQVAPHRAGRTLDVDGALASLRDAAIRRGEPRSVPPPGGPGNGPSPPEPIVIELPRPLVLPRVTSASLEHLDVRETVSEYSTAFAWAGGDAARARNIEVAAAHLDGVVLAPGDVVSFNDTVGPRTIDNGFRHAFQIYKGEMIAGVGGGTCQVSSTLHAAALHGGLDIVERAPHSRPLGYVPLGLDSTVVYPEVDLKLRNPWAFPVVVHTEVQPGHVRVQLLGARKPAAVAVSLATLKVTPFERKVEVHPELPAGRFRLKQKGIRGYDIRVMRRIAAADGTVRSETSVDRYPPTAELFWIAPGLEVESALPPLPEGAVRPQESQ
jgi:vancomycin resistance protein YoaR